MAADQSSSGTPDQKTERYFHLRALGLKRSDEDDFTQSCFESGAAGVAEDLRFSQTDLRYEPDVVETEILDLNVYFTVIPDEKRLLELQGLYPSVRFEASLEENKDWLLEWKKGFKPFHFSGPFWVIPSWCEPPPEAPTDKTKLIYVEPGMAFGTGTHETTRLAADLINEQLGRQKAESLLDVGTGTGILALIAYRLGVTELLGIDNDPEACRTARENLTRNSADAIQISGVDLKTIHRPYDIVVANIIDGVLAILRHDLVRNLRSGGRMILSGVLLERERSFYEEFCADTGMTLIKKISAGEWSAALLEKAKA